MFFFVKISPKEEDLVANNSKSNSVASSHSRQSGGISAGSQSSSTSSLPANSEGDSTYKCPVSLRRESGSNVSRLSPSVSSLAIFRLIFNLILFIFLKIKLTIILKL